MNKQNYRITIQQKKRISETNFYNNLKILNYSSNIKQDYAILNLKNHHSRKNLNQNELSNENQTNIKNISHLSFTHNFLNPIFKQKSSGNLLKKIKKEKINPIENNFNRNKITILNMDKINQTINMNNSIFTSRKYNTKSADIENSSNDENNNNKNNMKKKNKKLLSRRKLLNNQLTENFTDSFYISSKSLNKPIINYHNLKIKSSLTNKIKEKIKEKNNTNNNNNNNNSINYIHLIKKIPSLINPLIQKKQKKPLIKLYTPQVSEKNKNKIPINPTLIKKNNNDTFVDNILSNKKLNVEEIKENVKKIKEEIKKETLEKIIKKKERNFNEKTPHSKSKSEITNRILAKQKLKKNQKNKKCISSSGSFLNNSQNANKKFLTNLNINESLLNKIVSNQIKQKPKNVFTKVNIINKKFNTIEYNLKKDNNTISKNSGETKEEDNDTDSICENNKENNNNNNIINNNNNINNISKSSDSITDVDDFNDDKKITKHHKTIHQIFKIHKINRNPILRFNKEYFEEENKEKKNISFILNFSLKNIYRILSYDNKIIYTLNRINKSFNKFFKIIIYEKIKIKVLENQNIIRKKNIVKKYLFKSSPLYSNIKLLQKIYYENLYKCKSSYDNVIKADLPRTFPNDNSFKEGKENYNKLYRILSAYSNYNFNIGYAQGLNLIVGHILLTFEKEEEIFIFIDGLINKFKLENFIGINNKMKEKLNQVGKLIQKNVKKVCDYLDKNFLDHEFFSANWTLTLMANSMSNKNLMIFWDFMIIFGWKFFNYFVITVLNFYEKVIISSSQDELPFLMKNLLNSKQFDLDLKNIINETFYNMENRDLD